MELLTKAFLCVLVCALALVVGRSLAHAVTSSSAGTYGYDVASASSDLQSTDDLTGTLALSAQYDQSTTATPLVLSPQATSSLPSPVAPTATSAATEGPTMTPTSTPIPPYVKYTVRRGDTLLKLAQSFNTTRQAIIDINPTVSNLEDLHEGDKLRIPAIVTKSGSSGEVIIATATITSSAAGALTSTVEPEATSEPTSLGASPTTVTGTSTTDVATETTGATPTIASYVEYTVKRGDTLLAIAKSFNTTAKAILDLNEGINPGSLQVGQVLHIPKQ